LTAGCVISGRVRRHDHKPAPEGALERNGENAGTSFGPVGRIEADGSFHWATSDDGDVLLRAWPWKSPPTEFRTFACHEGARFADVTLTVLDHQPDLEGIVVDATGAPVPFAFLDIEPLDPGITGQQERADAAGQW